LNGTASDGVWARDRCGAQNGADGLGRHIRVDRCDGAGGGRRPAAVRRDGAGGAETDSGGAEGHSGPARWGRPVAVVVQQAAAARRTVAARD
jgi:hypothetical protein